MLFDLWGDMLIGLARASGNFDRMNLATSTREAAPLGNARPMPASAALKSVERIWSMGFPFNAKKKLKGLRLNATDAGWTAGEGELVERPVEDILLLVSGRTGVALPGLSGDGVETLKARLVSET